MDLDISKFHALKEPIHFSIHNWPTMVSNKVLTIHTLISFLFYNSYTLLTFLIVNEFHFNFCSIMSKKKHKNTALLISIGCILAYKTRGLDPKFGEAKQLGTFFTILFSTNCLLIQSSFVGLFSDLYCISVYFL